MIDDKLAGSNGTYSKNISIIIDQPIGFASAAAWPTGIELCES